MDISPTPKLLLSNVREIRRDYAVAACIGATLLIFLPKWFTYIFVFTVALCFLASSIALLIIGLKPRKCISINGKAVFISGCDSGFGHRFARRLDNLGFCVFAGCLFPDGEGAKKLKKSSSDRIHVVGLNVTNDNSVADAAEYVKNNLEEDELWAVVSNAGINDGSDILWTDVETIHRVIEVNTMGAVRVTKAFLPLICKSKGRVVVVASSAGRATFPGMVPYCMSKHAVVSFCDGLRMELYRFGVRVVSIEPWMYKTAITNAESTTNQVLKTWEKAPEDIKRMFPDEYLDAYIECVKNMLGFSKSDNLNQVVACLEEAITTKNPNYSYMPGTLYSRLSFWLTNRLPKAMSDMLVIDSFQYKIAKKYSIRMQNQYNYK